MATIFSKIINGEIPSYKIAENNEFFAFLDINPISKGHTLIVPKYEIDYMFDIPDDLLGRMHIFAKKIAAAIERVISCKRIGLVVYGLDVPHAHIHLIPIVKGHEINFTLTKLSLRAEEFKLIAAKISEEFNNTN